MRTDRGEKPRVHRQGGKKKTTRAAAFWPTIDNKKGKLVRAYASGGKHQREDEQKKTTKVERGGKIRIRKVKGPKKES